MPIEIQEVSNHLASSGLHSLDSFVAHPAALSLSSSGIVLKLPPALLLAMCLFNLLVFSLSYQQSCKGKLHSYDSSC